ncbi:MAG: DUF4010 domain-containing protein [Roseococcus sp.]|nr:DUF4010 domain-containing protein [Roseococcus sp.]
MDAEPLIGRLAVATAVGLLVGLERHWRERDEPSGHRVAGLRTFGLTGLLGGVAAVLGEGRGDLAGALLIGVTMIAFVLLIGPFLQRAALDEGSHSATTAVAALTTLGLGALAGAGLPAVAGAGAVCLAVLLAGRERLHGLMGQLTWPELRSVILLCCMTLLVLPLLPQGPMAELGGLDPARIWKLAIILAAVSFLGYVATRLLGPGAGLLLAGAAGGLVSSTAVTLSHASAARSGGAAGHLAAGALVAGAVSCVRTAVLLLVLAPELGLSLLPALLAAALGLMLVVLLPLAGEGAAAPIGQQKNPFEFFAVIRMAALLGGIGLAARLAVEGLGEGALLAVSAISGLADVDAVTLSVAGLVPDTIPLALGGHAVAVAVAANIIAKAGYALVLGGGAFSRRYLAGSAAGLMAGGVALWLA